jgi:ketopantoate reductase
MLKGYRQRQTDLNKKIFMKDHAGIIENIVVFGAGALGVSCGVARKAYLAPVGRVQLTFFNRKRLFETVELRETGQADASQILLNRCLPAPAFTGEFLRNLVGVNARYAKVLRPRISVWVVVPPSELDAACRQAAAAIRSFLDARAACRGGGSFAGIEVWICSNGLVLDESLGQLLELRAEGCSVYRALFLTGFESDWYPNSGRLLVRHTGGQDVMWGDLGGQAVETLTQPLGGVSSPGLAAPFRLQQVEAIRSLEIQKFFVNLVLGWVIGPYGKPNGSILGAGEKQGLSVLAAAFARLFPAGGAAGDLMALLERTARDTAQNVNSVSRAWSCGRPDSARYFRDAVLKAQDKGGRYDPVWHDFFCRHFLSE